jgi:diguanylate cyclase (GGDEF)-like protein
MPNRSLQTRIIALFLTLIVFVQLGGFVLVNSVGDSAARKTIAEDLVAGGRVFDRVREQERMRLVQAARLLSADQGFRQAIIARDVPSIVPVLERYGRQVGAELLMIIRQDDIVVVDTLGIGAGEPFFFPKLLNQARRAGQAAAMVVVRGTLYQLVVVPISVPGPYAWVAVGYAVNDDLARETGRLLRLDVSFASRFQQGEWRLQASTLSEEKRKALLREMAGDAFARSGEGGNALHGEYAVTRMFTMPAHTDDTVAVVLQQPLATAMEPFRRLQRQLAWISLCAVLISILASVLIARGIARPVRALAARARRLAAGDYSTIPATPRADEIGDLATAFRAMQEGLASREQRITNLAYRDTLTGLPNRTLYAERLDQALSASTDERTPVAVLLMDIDHFKYVNDTLGHPIGDLLLLEVAARIERVVERAGDTIARLGGDEFALLLPGHGAQEAHRLADAILRALEVPMTLDGHQVDVRASIGIAVAPDHGTERSALMQHADVAMYAAKRGNLGVLAWDDRYDQHSRERLSLMGDLRKAVDTNELTLMYQPKISLHNATDHCVEALVRWQHPARGLVPPAEFIPFAEQTGFIRAITQWVLTQAIAQCATWRRDGVPINVSINISPRDLMDIRLPERFADLLQAHGCAAHWIALEITESAIMDDPARAIENLGRLHALGCRLAIDDFGTGYSSLAYLRRLPVDELKIDKSFVMNMARDASDAMIVRSTIDLAHNMGLTVVAEGVDDEAVLERLRVLSCDMVQGYLLSRPLAAAEVPARLLGLADVRDSTTAKGLRRVV